MCPKEENAPKKEEIADTTLPAATSTTTIVTLQRTIGFWSATGICVGAIIGSGIFITPSKTFFNTGSIGLDIGVWTFCGLLTLIGSLCYVELSTTVPASGSEYAYLLVASRHLGGGYWEIIPFLSSWSLLCINDSLSTAVLSKTFVSYILTLVYNGCPQNGVATNLLAVVFITFTLALNLTNMNLLLRMQNSLSSIKIITLVGIIGIGGYLAIFQENKLEGVNWLEGSKTAPRDVVSAIYGALWAYSGWKSITCITEEVINPRRNVPLSILVGIAIVTTVYILTNIAYFIGLSADQVLSSDAVAVTFMNEAFHFEPLTRVVPLLVGLSVFGCFSGHYITNGRIFLSAAREGHLWSSLSEVHYETGIPVLTMFVRSFLGIVFLYLGTVDQLIELPIFLECVSEALAILALILFRWTLPDAKRVIRVPYIFLIMKLAITGYILYATLTSTKNLLQYLVLASVLLLGVVVYIVFVKLKMKLPFKNDLEIFLQKLLLTVPCDNAIIEDLSKRTN